MLGRVAGLFVRVVVVGLLQSVTGVAVGGMTEELWGLIGFLVGCGVWSCLRPITTLSLCHCDLLPKLVLFLAC